MEYLIKTYTNENDTILDLIRKINFNDNQPSNHNFCVTSINDKHASVIDTDNNNCRHHAVPKCELPNLFFNLIFHFLYCLEFLHCRRSARFNP